MSVLQKTTKDSRLQLLKETTAPFSERAWSHNEETVFPHQNIKDLKHIQYPSLTAPIEYGGMEISLLEFIQSQEIIAQADGSTALSIGWHVGIVKDLTETRPWPEPIFKQVCEAVTSNQALLNNTATEAATGSPTRGGKPLTEASRSGDGWMLTGRKTFTTLAPALDYFVVSAGLAEEDRTANFLVPRTTPGVSIDETWDSIAMRGTGSHDLVLNQAWVPEDHLVTFLNPGNKKAAGWLLHIPACYLGIAQAAADHAVAFAKEYSPNTMNGTISDIPAIQEKIGQMEAKLIQSRHFLHSVARQWDEASAAEREQMKPELGTVKRSVVNEAVAVVDLAMRIEGARSLSASNPLQRYYRDVRAGLHNPPMDDMTITMLAKEALNRH